MDLHQKNNKNNDLSSQNDQSVGQDDINQINQPNQKIEQQNEQQLNGDGSKKLSKRQQRKLQKKQKWEQIKLQKRKQQRQKQKLKRKQKRDQLQLQKKQQQQQQQQNKVWKQGQQPAHKKRKQQYKQKMLDGLKVVIDLQFYDLMTDKERSSLGKQLAYCHSVNRKSAKCFNFILTSVTQPRLKFLNEKYNVENFNITILEQNVIEAFDKNKLVYLTGDADEQIQQLDPEQIYIIGGIVDHNRLKNITINYAREKQIKARRLPMEGVKLKASVHLAVNHVWQWMLKFYNGSTWKQAIKSVIPQRKLQDSQANQ